jgi:hypothetical protein
MWPTAPHASVSASVNPAGSPVCRPESRASSLSPAVAFRFADGDQHQRRGRNHDLQVPTRAELIYTYTAPPLIDSLPVKEEKKKKENLVGG